MRKHRYGHVWLFGIFVMLLTACAVAPSSDGAEFRNPSSVEQAVRVDDPVQG